MYTFDVFFCFLNKCFSTFVRTFNNVWFPHKHNNRCWSFESTQLLNLLNAWRILVEQCCFGKFALSLPRRKHVGILLSNYATPPLRMCLRLHCSKAVGNFQRQYYVQTCVPPGTGLSAVFPVRHIIIVNIDVTSFNLLDKSKPLAKCTGIKEWK